MSKVVFSSLFFFHRTTVKPSPRQLDPGALLANFLHKRTLCSMCAIFFYLPRRRLKPFYGSRGFFSIFFFLNVVPFFNLFVCLFFYFVLLYGSLT